MKEGDKAAADRLTLLYFLFFTAWLLFYASWEYMTGFRRGEA